MILEPSPGFTFSSKTYFRDGELLSPVTNNDFHIGTHEEAGIFVIAGEDVDKCDVQQEQHADLQDMMTTLLHWLGLPVPEHCDGKVRQEWFRTRHEIAYHQLNTAVANETVLSDTEQKEIENRLQTLGYM